MISTKKHFSSNCAFLSFPFCAAELAAILKIWPLIGRTISKRISKILAKIAKYHSPIRFNIVTIQNNFWAQINPKKNITWGMRRQPKFDFDVTYIQIVVSMTCMHTYMHPYALFVRRTIYKLNPDKNVILLVAVG